MLASPESRWPSQESETYRICIRRFAEPDVAGCIGISLRNKLPTIPIRLRSRDVDVVLDLQSIIADCYRDGRCGNTDYLQAPIPILDRIDSEWAQQLLQHRWQGLPKTE